MNSFENTFWIIFDTGTRPEYYQDVHNILALPSRSVVRYNYNKKYIDDQSLEYIDAGKYPENVILMYTEFKNYKREDGIDGYKKLYEENSEYNIIPTRICRLLNIQEVDTEVYFDLELNDFPYTSEKNYINNILESTNFAIPTVNGKYVSVSDRQEDFEKLKNIDSNLNKWASIVKYFQENSQFNQDSFWRLQGPFKNNGEKIIPEITYNKLYGSTFLNHYEIKEDTEFYFNLYNYEPKGNIKYDKLKQANNYSNLTYNDLERSVKIDDTHSPVVAFLKKIVLRQYFISKVKFQKNFNSELFTKEGACYFNTKGQFDYWPIGPNFYIYFRLSRNYYLVVIGVILLLLGVGIATYDQISQKICPDPLKGFFLTILSVLLIITSSFILYRQIKTKL
tara:strand:+ start:4257 stop:5438 length:1182 start_codon:yes stop_codon:yes gene_type:complete